MSEEPVEETEAAAWEKFRGDLGAIIRQLESCGYECPGGPLENNIAFQVLKEMAEEVSPNDQVLP